MVEINNLTDFNVDKSEILRLAKLVLKGENKESESVSIAFISPEEIHQLNKQFRRKDKPTDVLAFERNPEMAQDVAEVVVCPEVVKEKTKDSELSFEKELANTLIHGILHVLGYDHERSRRDEKEMFEKQQYYLSSL